MGQIKKAPENLAFIGGSVIVAVIALVVFIGGSNAGDCPRSKSAEASSIEGYQKADKELKPRLEDVY